MRRIVRSSPNTFVCHFSSALDTLPMAQQWPWSHVPQLLPPTSLYCALPLTPPPPEIQPALSLFSIHFTAFDPTILNCIVVGPRWKVYYRTSTTIQPQTLHLTTQLKDDEGNVAATIDWSESPRVAIRGHTRGVGTSEWLASSHEGA